MSHLMSLSGAKRTWAGAVHMSAFDPKRTSLVAPHMTQIALDRARIDALIGQLVAAGVAQHVRVDFHIEAGDLSRACASVSLVSWQREADKADIKTAPEECVKFNPAGIISRIS